MLVGRSGSIQADLNYYQSICRPDDYFPSPERFVYTLPNIVAGEIAIRHRYHGETSFLLLPRRDDEAVTTILRSAFLDAETTSVLGGWIDCEDDSRFEAELSIIE
jgi:3-oxoacyl-[acyl-carrier-protein] synthase-1